MKIGCIGQGFVGKNIADNFVVRGFEVVRYSLEPDFLMNKEKISDCDVVFIAVPTPSTSVGCDYSIVESALSVVGDGKTAVIKSTIPPGTSKKLQLIFSKKTILFSPEFLSEITAAYDIANPILNVVGYDNDLPGHKESANLIMSLLPECEHNFIVSLQAAELFKYAHNMHGYFRIILSNLLLEIATTVDADWAEVSSMMDKDVMMSPYYNQPTHKGGRGAGGACFIKDMAAFRALYAKLLEQDTLGLDVFKAVERKNIELLQVTGKSIDQLNQTYGDSLQNLK